MEKYVEQLLGDIQTAIQNVSWPFVDHDLDIHDWITDEEEDSKAPIRNLEDWTGIKKDQLPPSELLSDTQIERVLMSLKKLLDTCNWTFVLQTKVPVRIQYETIRENFDQEIKLKRWHMGFFQLCKPGTEYGKCVLGDFCECKFFDAFFSKFDQTELSPEEERANSLEIEIRHLKRKYGDDWKKYYPHHLDPD